MPQLLTPRRLAVTVLVVVALGVAGCGSDDGAPSALDALSERGEPSTTTTTVDATTTTEVPGPVPSLTVVDFPLDCTGPRALADAVSEDEWLAHDVAADEALYLLGFDAGVGIDLYEPDQGREGRIVQIRGGRIVYAGRASDELALQVAIQTAFNYWQRDAESCDFFHGEGPHYVETLLHPTLGELTLVVAQEFHGRSTGWVQVLDARGNPILDAEIVDIETLHPLGQRPDGTGSFKTQDRDGHVFVVYNPGRYEGTIVLVPTAEGYDDLGTLDFDDASTNRFYSVSPIDGDGDGAYELEEAINDCEPTCAEGTVHLTVLRWDGTDYRAG